MRNLTENWIVRRFGVRTFKIYSGAWFVFMYALLVGVTGRGLGALNRHVAHAGPSGQDTTVIYVAVTLAVIVAALLTWMFARLWSSIRDLESDVNHAT
jgi:hypothetical protein